MTDPFNIALGVVYVLAACRVWRVLWRNEQRIGRYNRGITYLASALWPLFLVVAGVAITFAGRTGVFDSRHTVSRRVQS